MDSFIGINIRRFRREADLSSDELAAAVGLSSVRVIETRGTGNLHNIERIASFLSKTLGREITLAELVSEPPPDVLTEIRGEMSRRSALAVKARRRAKRRKAS